MSLNALNELERSSKDIGRKSDRCTEAAKLLADMRNGPHSLIDALDKVVSRWKYGPDELAKDELHAVLNEMASDIYRIAEMRLAAKARFHKVNAAQKRAILTASILPMQDFEGERRNENPAKHTQTAF